MGNITKSLDSNPFISSSGTIEAAALSLTRPAVDTYDEIVSFRPLDDVLRQITNARDLAECLLTQSAFLRCQMAHETQHDRKVLAAVEARDFDALAQLGLDFQRARFDVLMTALAAEGPFVEIETVGPYAMFHVDDNGDVDFRLDQIPCDERTGLVLGAALREATLKCPNVRPVALIDDLHNSSPDDYLTKSQQDRYVVEVSKLFLDSAIIRPHDVPGKDFVLVRESELLARFDQLIEQLSCSDHGIVEETADRDIVFWPSRELIAHADLRSERRERELRRSGILLRRSGRVTCTALDASGYLDPLNREIIHLVMLDTRFKSQQAKTHVLLLATESVAPDAYNNIFYDSHRLSPQLTSYAVLKLLARAMEDHLERLRSSAY